MFFEKMTPFLKQRLILSLGGKTVSCHLPDGKTLTFFELPSLPCDINDDPVQSLRLTYIHFELNEFVGHKAPSRDEILPIFSILARNEVTIKDDSECPRGSAIYLEASEFEHSCQGNATFDFNGKYLLARYVGPNSLKRPVKISRDFKVSRSALLWDTPTRQQFLRDQFSISCNCGNCRQDPLEVDHFKQGCLKCPECDGPVPVPKTSKQKSTKQIRCPNCQRNVSTEALETFWILKPKLRKIYENGVVSFDIRGSLMTADDWRITLEADRCMHYYDQDYLNCLLIGTKFAMLNDSYGIALDMCLKVVQALDFYLSIPSFLTAKVHYNICLAANALRKYALLRKHVEKAMNLVAITRGREHHLNSKLALFEVVSRFGSCDDFSDTD